MDLVKIVFLSLGSIVILFVLTKLMGNRELSQLSMFDYVVSITIGSIAAEMSTSLDDNFLEPVVAMIVYGVVTLLISVFAYHSIKFRRFISGKSLIIFDDGELYRENLKKSNIDLNEFLTQCRINGYFNLSELQTAILEPNGKISFLPKNSKKPIVPSDVNIPVVQEKILTNVIIDGIVLKENLRRTGHNEVWLEKQVKEQGASSFKDIFLATCSDKNNLNIYFKTKKESSNDLFQ